MEGRSRSGAASDAKAGGGTPCIPGRRGRRRLSPASLLDRLREVVFRLIMLSAIAKKGAAGGPRQQGGAAGARAYWSDAYRSEAVEDCIEFFKRSASGEGAKSPGLGGDAAAEVAFRPCQSCEA